MLLSLAVLGGCAATGPEMRSSRLPSVELLEEQLERGVSRKSDVERVLGKPTGRGAALSGVQPERPRELWVYGEMGWSLIGFEDDRARVHLDQQLLMVFFEGDVFDGYWWHSNAGAATATTQ